MIRRMMLPALVMVLSASLYACDAAGSSSSSTDPAEDAAAGSTSEEQAIEATVDAYFKATSADEVCENISLGFESFLDDRSESRSDPSSPADEACPEVIEKAEKEGGFEFEASEVDIEHVLVDGDKAAVRLVNPSLSEDAYPVFLVKSSPGWLIAAENFAPPGFEDLYADVMASGNQSS